MLLQGLWAICMAENPLRSKTTTQPFHFIFFLSFFFFFRGSGGVMESLQDSSYCNVGLATRYHTYAKGLIPGSSCWQYHSWPLDQPSNKKKCL